MNGSEVAVRESTSTEILEKNGSEIVDREGSEALYEFEIENTESTSTQILNSEWD
jgi:hypothetical protein